MSEKVNFLTECIHGRPVPCEECTEMGATNRAEYGAYEPLIRPQRIKLLEEMLK